MPPRSPAPLLLALLLALAPTAGSAQTAQRPPEGHPSDVVVRARPFAWPQVVFTYPARGSEVASGTLVVTVRFNQAMDPQGWSYAAAPGADFPACLPRPRLLADERTFVLLCATAAGRRYALGLNAAPADGFADPFHRFATRYDLAFTTSASAEPVRPVEEALKAAGLTPSDSPIMTWQGHAGDPAVAQTAAPGR